MQLIINLSVVSSLLFYSVVSATAKEMSRYKDLSEDIRFIIRAIHHTCKKQTGINEDAIKQIQAGNIQDDLKTKEYMACIWLESTMMDEFGNLNIDLMYDLCPESLKDIVPKRIIDCHEKQPVNLSVQEKVFGMEKCLYEADPENFVMI